MNVLGFDLDGGYERVRPASDGQAFERDLPPAEPPAHARSCCRRSPRWARRVSPTTRSTPSRWAWGRAAFTGLRIGVATAQALASSTGYRAAPGVSSLAALTEEHRRRAGAAPLIDARRGEVFAALYEAGELRFGPLAEPPEAVVERIRDAGVDPLAAGDGSVRFRGVLEAAGIGWRRRARAPTRFAGSRSAGWRRPRRRHRPRPSSPSTSDAPTPSLAVLADPRYRAPHLRRPAAGDRDRAARVPHALVAGDVRAQALQAVRGLPGGHPGRASWWAISSARATTRSGT